ncbi:GTP-binding protein, partial [Rhizobium ruizarguesonis]
KGFFWLATRPYHVGEISQAGAIVRTGKRGIWWAAVPREQWPEEPAFMRAIGPYLDPVWGDRRQELVFIGAGFDEDAIRTALGDCLIGEETGFDPQTAAGLRDPFPAWQHAHSNS